MIRPGEIECVGRVNKTHGTQGEMSVSLDDGIEPADLSCIIMDMDGIFVPFFVRSSRPRGNESWLVLIDGIDSEREASDFVGKDLFALRTDLGDDECEDTDGFYLDDLTGYTLLDTAATIPIGIIEDIEASTDNTLFIVNTCEGNNILIPAAVELIVAIDHDTRQLTMNLPAGLLDM